ncbi:MAG: glycine-rich protein, partial [Dehalococcoidia bacterium]
MAHHLSNGAHRPSRLRRRAALVMLPVLLPLLAIATPAPMAQAQPPPPTVTFEYTGAVQQWTVPSNVRLAEFAVYGAQGGSDWGSGGAGGRGGQVVATFPVAPGDTIFLYVGGKGGDSSTGPISCGTGAGGFNGGGRGGNYVANPGLCNGAGGGGASDVRVGGAALTKRVLVAGGRGAGTIPACAAGGAGGGLVGGNGACFDNGNVTGGGGGGQSSSGLGCPCIPAGNGDLGTGGVGANANQGGDIRDGNGAGGGSGYHGGGGGRVNPPDVFGNGGAGGGGSGHGPANTAFQSSVQEGQGRIVITYYVLDPPQVLGITSNAGSEKGGTSVTITGANFTTPDGVVPTVPTTVTFGDTPASSVSCTSSECTAVSPPGSLGTVS